MDVFRLDEDDVLNIDQRRWGNNSAVGGYMLGQMLYLLLTANKNVRPLKGSATDVSRIVSILRS